MSHNAIDYFVTLGRSPGPLECKSFPLRIDDESEPLTAQQAWKDAITDIILLGPGEELPDEESWTFLTETNGGHPTEPPFIAFRRRVYSNRLDHICQVKFVAPGEVVPPHFELLRSTASGKGSGYIKPHGYLAIKRAPVNEDYAISGRELLFDICIVRASLKEQIPEHYFQIEKDSVGTIAAFSSHDTIVAIRKLPAMGICDLGYAASPLDRYPLKDLDGQPLPSEALPVFAFPRYLRMLRAKRNQYPLPVFFTFVFTDQDGKHLYAACLKFFEVLSPDLFQPIVENIYGDSTSVLLPADEAIFCPKVICVLTRKPFYRAMRRYLRHIYSLSLSSAVCPLEHFISAVVHQVPLPVEGGRPFHVVLDAALISVHSKPMSPIIFNLPPARFFPTMDLDFAGPLRCLSIDCMLAVYTLMLREAKLVFLSCSNTMLTETMETLRMLLFPLTWPSCFVSRLPISLHGLLQAPGGIMIGIHVESSNANLSSSQEVRKFIDEMHYQYPLVTGTYIIDLTSSSIFQYNGHVVDKLQSYEQENILKTLPLGPKLRLRAKLHKIAEEYRIAPQTCGLEEFDSAFDFQASEDNAIPREKWDEFPSLELRDSFMSFIIDVLGDYPKYIIPPVEDMLAESYRTFREEFGVENYLADADPSCRPLLDYLMETQMFSVLLQHRSEGNAESVVFFEQASELQRELGLSAGGHGMGVAKATIVVCELPLPLYVLLSKEDEWSALTKVMQQQILQSRDTKKAHRINCLTSSGLSPIRTNGAVGVAVSYSSQAITNQKLLDLLLYNDFTYSPPQHHLDNESDSPYYFVARKELDRTEDLQLGNEDFGPVIIAGPTMDGTMDFAARGEHEVIFSYPSWPMMQPALLAQGEASVHPRVKEIRKARVDALSKANLSFYRMIRSPVERLATFGNLLNKGKDKPIAAHADVLPMLSAIMDITSISMTMLVVRILNNIKPSNDMLQLLGIIAQIERVNLLPSLNETVWRSILIACEAVGGHIMRRIAYVIFQCMESVRGVSANAITYGRYVQALGAKKLNMPEPIAGDVIDQFLFLEEVGFTWYIQKTALTAQSQILLHNEELTGVRKPSDGSSKKKVIVNANTEAARVVAAKLNLQGNPGFLPFMKPVQFSAAALPTKASIVTTSANVDFITMRARAYLDQFSAACMPSVRTYALPSSSPNNRIRTQSHNSDGTMKKVDSMASTPERLSNMISLGSSATMQVVSKLSSSWLPSGLSRSAPTSIKTVEASKAPIPAAKTPQPQASGWRSFFGGARTPNSASMPSMPTVHEASPDHAAAKTALLEPGPVAGERKLDDGSTIQLDQMASTLVFDDEEGSDGHGDSASESGSNAAAEHSGQHEPQPPKHQIMNVILEEMHLDEHHADEPAATTTATASTVEADTSMDDPIVSSPADDNPDDNASADGTTPSVRDKSTSNASTSTTTDRANNEFNIIGELNDKVMECFTQHFMEAGTVMSMHSESPCKCGFILMDEEILSLWCRSASMDIHGTQSPSGRNLQRRKSQIQVDPRHQILCPQCSKEINPKLHVSKHEKQRNPEHDHPLAMASAGEEISMASTDVEEANYLSPFVLRAELEEALVKIGNKLASADSLYEHNRHLFWNILWYTNRFALPSGLFSSEQSNKASFCDFPLIIGWSKEVVKAKSKRALQGMPGDMLEIKDIFHFCSEDERKIIMDEVLTNLDSSPAGMRQALMSLSRCKSLSQHAFDQRQSVERLMYTSIMALALNFAHFNIFDKRKPSLQRDLSQDCVFDKIFVDAIKCVMSPSDFADMNVNEQTLVDCGKNKTANIIRSMFGIMA